MKTKLALILLLTAACGKEASNNSWKTPSVQFVRADQDQNKTLNQNDKLKFDDQLNVVSENNEVSTIQTELMCDVGGKAYSQNSRFTKTQIQVKEMVPPQAFLTKDKNEVTCTMNLVVANQQGSTKRYASQSKTIENNISTYDLYVPKVVNFDRFKSVEFTQLDSKGTLELACDALTSTVKVMDTTLNLEDLAQQSATYHEDLPMRKYKPHQVCRVIHRTSETTKWSQAFEIQFEKLYPKYSFVKSHLGAGLNWYYFDLTLENPYTVPVSVGIKKSNLTSDYLDKKTKIEYSFSNLDYVIEKENVYVVHLPPNSQISLKAHKACGGMACMERFVSPEELPVYHLEYNFRSEDEAMDATDVKLLNQVPLN